MPNILGKINFLQTFIAKKIFKLIKNTNISPNQITVFRFIFGIMICIFFITKGNYLVSLTAVIILFFLSTLDILDGMVARHKNIQSENGRFLDDSLDFLLILTLLCSIYFGYFLEQIFWSIIFILLLFIYIFINMLLVEFDKLGIPNIYQRTFDDNFFRNSNIDKTKLNISDKFLIAIIDPNQNFVSGILFNFSYLIFLGFLINQIKLIFLIFCISFFFRSFLLLYINISLRNKKSNKFYILNILKQKVKY